MPAGCSTRSASHEHFDELHDILAADLRPKPDPHGYALLCERFGIDPESALLVEDMAAEPRAGQGAGHDDGMGRQWLGARRHLAEEAIVDRPSSPMSANGSKRSWRTIE